MQDVSSSFDIESSIGPSCCLMPSYALQIAINESYCMLLLGMSLFSENPLSTHSHCPCEKKISIYLSTRHISAYSSLFPICSLKNTSRLSSFDISFARMQCTHFVAPQFVMGLLHFFSSFLHSHLCSKPNVNLFGW